MSSNQFWPFPSRVFCKNKTLINRLQLFNNHLQIKSREPHRLQASFQHRTTNMKIVPVPVREDNYAYLIIDEKLKSAAVVDPFDPIKVIKAAEEENVSLSGAILTTHHHQDHSGGNEELISILKEQSNKHVKPQVYGGSFKIPGLTSLVKDGTKFMLSSPSKTNQNQSDCNDQTEQQDSSIQVTCLATPCHTRDSICFYVNDLDGGPGSVFTGDTLFIAGCGRFFEGTADEMDHALNQILGSLPNNTITYNGHEYTKANIAFARSIEPENQHVLDVAKVCDQNDSVITMGKYTIGDEKKFNPFMRLEEPSVLNAVGLDSSSSRIQVMQKLRELKNSFKM